MSITYCGSNRIETNSGIKCHVKCIPDLNFANDILLISDDENSAQSSLISYKVSLKINRANTEFTVIYYWTSLLELRASSTTIYLVKNLKN
jgi:hypothetical protein